MFMFFVHQNVLSGLQNHTVKIVCIFNASLCLHHTRQQLKKWVRALLPPCSLIYKSGKVCECV
jgi:hypothetical protein